MHQHNIKTFERFTAGPTLRPEMRQYVSISKEGTILMNRNIFDALGAPQAVVLSFERKLTMIALSPAHRELKDAFPLISKNGSWYINAAPFCKHFGIMVEKTVQFIQPQIDAEGVLCLDLTKTTSAAHRKPRRR